MVGGLFSFSAHLLENLSYLIPWLYPHSFLWTRRLEVGDVFLHFPFTDRCTLLGSLVGMATLVDHIQRGINNNKQEAGVAGMGNSLELLPVTLFKVEIIVDHRFSPLKQSTQMLTSNSLYQVKFFRS